MEIGLSDTPLDIGLARGGRDARIGAERPSISVVIPTINEAANLSLLANRVAAVLNAAYEILIIDDGSRDGTAEVCARLAERLPITLHYRSKPISGLGGAVLYGFTRACGEIFVVMDGDLQHPPEALPEILAPLMSGRADFVIGSRRVDGARVVGRWGWLRRANSGVARLLAVPLVGRVRDPMSGFFAVRRACIEGGAPLNPIGYKIGLELIVKCRLKRIVEVPIEFGPRHGGRSKLTVVQQFNYLRHLVRLYGFVLRRRVWPGRGGGGRVEVGPAEEVVCAASPGGRAL